MIEFWWHATRPRILCFTMKWNQVYTFFISKVPATAFLHASLHTKHCSMGTRGSMQTQHHPSSFLEKKRFFKGNMVCSPYRQPFTFSEEQFAFLVWHHLRRVYLWLGSLFSKWKAYSNDLMVCTKDLFESPLHKAEKCLRPWNGGSSLFSPSHQCLKDVKTELQSGLRFKVPWVTYPPTVSVGRKFLTSMFIHSVSHPLIQHTFAECLLCMKHCFGHWNYWVDKERQIINKQENVRQW